MYSSDFVLTLANDRRRELIADAEAVRRLRTTRRARRWGWPARQPRAASHRRAVPEPVPAC